MSRFLSAACCTLFVFAICSTEVSATPASSKVYDASCASCHNGGIMGAPKLGDKAAWAPRIAQGNAKLVSNSEIGFTGKKGMMPAKGGNPKLSSADVKVAVAYMVEKSK